jgi:hypothetical protein
VRIRATRRLSTLLAAFLLAGVAAAPAQAIDVNGDGTADLVVGVQAEDLPAANTNVNIVDAGAADVLFGSSTGIAPFGQLLGQSSAKTWLQGSSVENGDLFGHAVAGGDFNGDGFDDVAFGVPDEDVNTTTDDGLVNVAYGSDQGLTPIGSTIFDEATFSHTDTAGDHFGFALAVGDFNHDGFDDLAVGAPQATGLTSEPHGGTVTILSGSATGLTANTQAFLSNVVAGSSFGAALAAGDFNGDGTDDLAIGEPGATVGAQAQAGEIVIVLGSSTSMSLLPSMSESSAHVGDASEHGDQFGSALAAANFGKGAPADLAVGVPGERVVSGGTSGATDVLYGSTTSSTAFNTSGNQHWTQDSPNVLDQAEPGDTFGESLAAANFGNGAQADLAIGNSLEDVGTVDAAGMVNVLYGSTGGLSATGNQLWTQGSGIGDPQGPEASDEFGSTLAAANYGNGPPADLAIGVPLEDLAGISTVGAAHVIYGSSTGLTATGAQFLHQNSPGVPDTEESGDEFGTALG